MRTHNTHITPFTTGHIADAARLLDARHAADRAREPALPPSPLGHLRLELDAALGVAGSQGVAAVRDARMVGYLVGTPMLLPATDPLAAYFAPRSVRVPYVGHAADAADADRLYRALYTALATEWTQRTILAHYVQLPATDLGALATWHALGFGLDMGVALRDSSPLARAGAIDHTIRIRIRRAGPPDSAAVWELERALARHEAGAPVFFPTLPAAEPAARAEFDLQLANPATHCWLAECGGQALGTLTCVSPPRHLSALLTPARTINIASCAVDPLARGMGVGTALLTHALGWAREAGYAWLRLTWMTANPLSSRFWHGHGFRPIMYRLARRVDERATEGTGDT